MIKVTSLLIQRIIVNILNQDSLDDVFVKLFDNKVFHPKINNDINA